MTTGMLGVLLTPLRQIPSLNGPIFHAMKAGDPGCMDFGEAYFSLIDSGAIKGWKRHTRMTLNLVVPVGRIQFRVHDEAAGRFANIVLSPTDDYARLTVSPGLWMAFGGLDAQTSMLLNIADLPHDPAEAVTSELDRFRWEWAR
ncbi:dTDP-4-dehydrorhamnose 3,5-epimerase [Novosphingobium aquimarinum]|uniref:dTDP-4-dehydrorhamnose 3,5-epimerase n=1 Tax=Novosphingobium aquimarinum TaxID=2682494 RepID=UPI001E3BAAAE|nr:dTDP-4-dehydrorhamnose 3,5-epimerase [Novosphingobium aquimarinum]